MVLYYNGLGKRCHLSPSRVNAVLLPELSGLLVGYLMGKIRVMRRTHCLPGLFQYTTG